MNARIVIVGAGPVGLALALGLAHHGVSSIVLEREDGMPPRPDGIAIWPRTMEILADWGAADAVRAAGSFQRTLDVRESMTQRRLISIDFSSIADILDAPGSLIVREDDALHILRECVERSGLCQIRTGVAVTGVSQDDCGVRIDAVEGGRPVAFEAPFVAGCDGAQSPVRISAGLALAAFSAGGAVLREEYPGAERPQKQTIRLGVDAPGVLAGLCIVPGAWQRAPRYVAGRVALAGDAAHVVAPPGGEGFNSGIHDAANLAWKLAYAIGGRSCATALLESYDCERVQATVALAERISDRFCRSVTDSPQWLRSIGFALVSKALAPRGMQRKLSRALGMLSGRYTHSPILDNAHPMAGRRIDNLVLANGKRLSEERKGRAAVVVIGDAQCGNYAAIRIERAPKRWCVKAPALAIVRPDGIVAAVIEKPTPEKLEAAWTRAFAIRNRDAPV